MHQPSQLRTLRTKSSLQEQAGFPFEIPAVRTLEEIDFTRPVTFFVGENGSGKSTLLEALAAGAKLPAVGSHNVEKDESLVHARRLAAHLTLSWERRTHRGFFLRAEDFFGFTRKLKGSMQELGDLADHYDRTATGLGRLLARGAAEGQKDALVSRYGQDPDANSHGESFLKLFQSRFVPDGLYLLDEPEAPLSPKRQIAFLAILLDMVKQGAQFVIATHSPIIMAFPEAEILSFDETPIKSVPYGELEHVFITRSFLDNPERYLKHLKD